MSLSKNTSLTLAALASLGLAAHPVYASTSIGIHFQGSDNSLVQGDAGAIIQTSTWNNLSGNTNIGTINYISAGTQSSTIVDSTGASTGTMITYNASGTYRSNASNSDPNTALMSGYLDTDNTTPTIATVSNIGYTTYDVYVYSLGDTSGRGATYNIGGTTYYLNSDSPNFSDGFQQVTSTNSNSYGTGNFMEFTGLTGSSFTLTATPTYPNGQAARAPLNGIQIVDDPASPAPEPSQIGMIALLATGLGGLLLRARNRVVNAA